MNRQKTVIMKRWLAALVVGLFAFTGSIGQPHAAPSPYTCYICNQAIWGAVKAIVIFVHRWDPSQPEAASVVFRPTPLPGACYEFTPPYTDYMPDQVTWDQPSGWAVQYGAQWYAALVHNHPDGWAVPGFSEYDLNDFPVDQATLNVLIEDSGRCVRFYDPSHRVWPETPTDVHSFGQCR